MIVKVEMTEEEAREFFKFREDKNRAKRFQDNLSVLASSARNALAPDPNNPGKYIIIDQDHADDLFAMAEAIA